MMCLRVMLSGWVLGMLCSCYPQNQAQDELHTPDPRSFPLVADALSPSCGTLDCHGQWGRNLRLFGGRGLRLAPGENPADGATTQREYDASFRSLVGLEPERLTDVLLYGLDPAELVLVRKARGKDAHKGGVQMLVGDPLDRCLTSWLSGSVHSASCQRVSSMPRPQSVLMSPPVRE